MKHGILQAGRTSSLAIVAAIALAGCGGGGDGETASAPATGANSAPTIQGAPSTSVVAGQTYSFQPTASDPDGDSLTFSISNKPAWAAFDASTGKITGTPTAADVATYSSIRVTVSDGKGGSASTAMFAITVTTLGSGSVTLSWTPPTQNDDGSALTDLAGYEVRYGKDQANLDQFVQLNNPSLNTFVVDSLTSGTWFFAIRSINSSGNGSVMSNVASKTIT
jgi:putative Ig domain-containing protein